MSLSSIQLDAFFEVSKTKSFSKAANNLHITQSALSQRIINLEAELETGLIIRETSGIRLTEFGKELLRYCQIREGFEGEILRNIKNNRTNTLAGIIRIGGYSSIMQSVIMPSLHKLISENAGFHIEMLVREIGELPSLLDSGEVDFVLLDHYLNKDNIETHLLGYEHYVLVESKALSRRKDIYLDHDPNDTITRDFFKLQNKKPKKIKRSFLDDIYGIIDGVRLGWGKAILPLHIIKKYNNLKITEGYRPLKMPVILHFHQQPFYPKVHQKIRQYIFSKAPPILHQ